MRIGINVSWMSPGQAGGMEWYVRNLIRELMAQDQRHDYLLVTSPQNWHTFTLSSPRWRRVTYEGQETSPIAFAVLPGAGPPRPSWPRRLYHWLRSPRQRRWRRGLNELIRHERLDLWFCPLIYLLPVDVEIPAVVTIPDLQHEHFPAFFSAPELALRAMGYRYSCGRAVAVLGISEFVAQDVRTRYGLDERRAVATPLALDPSYTVTSETRARLLAMVRLKYRLDHEFLYYPANGWRHKNHEALVRALGIVRGKGRDVRLVLTGCEFDVLERIRPLFDSLAEARSVRHLGYVDRADTIGLYAAASTVVVPSLFEGFGLPLLEAMQLGTPVVCLPVGSVPEVGGHAVLYAGSPDPHALADAVLRVLEDDGLRQRLVAAGLEQVRRFSFAETARRTLAVFDDVLSGRLPAPGLPAFRPLIAHGWLREGLSRWYFHCEDLCEVRLEVAQPTRLRELADQRITVWLDGEPALETGLQPEQVRTVTVKPPRQSAGGLHRLEVRATATATLRGEVLSAQVRALTIVRADGSELELIA